MRNLGCIVLAMACGCASLARAQQSSPPAATAPATIGAQSTPGANQAPKGEIQPQVWPPPQSEAPAASNAAPPSREHAAPAATDDGRIHLDVVVSDKAGNPIGGLTAGDFTLLDNRKPRKIDSFQALNGANAQGDPVQIVLAIDLVNIRFDRVAISRHYISQFLRQDNGRLAHPVSIVWVTDDGLQRQLGPSLDGNALASQLDRTEGQLRFLGRAAGAWGAVERFNMSARMLDQMLAAMGRYPGRKLLIWVGPGWPMLANPGIYMTWKEQQQLFRKMVYLTTKLRKAQTELYSVAEGIPDYYTYLYQSFLKPVKKPSQIYLPNLTLKVLATWSGGQVRLPTNDLASAIARCVKDAGAYYRISFTPPADEHPDEFHQLQVKVDKPGLRARTSEMYYNQPANQDARLAPRQPKGGS